MSLTNSPCGDHTGLHLEYAVEFWAPCLNGDIAVRLNEIARGLENTLFE